MESRISSLWFLAPLLFGVLLYWPIWGIAAAVLHKMFGGVYFHPYEILVYVPAALGGLGSIVGGVIAWAANKRRNEKKARIFLAYGLAFAPIVDLIWVLLILLAGPKLLEGLLVVWQWLSPYR
jgi:hypothetical protein